MNASAQKDSLYEKHWITEKNDTLPYRIFKPDNYNPSKKYPLILFLHGAGERGNDNEAQLVHGSSLFLQDSIREQFPAFVVFPQCQAASYWSNVNITTDSVSKKRTFEFHTGGEPTIAMQMLEKLIVQLKKDYSIDKKRMYVGGLSMGGMGTFELVRRNPSLFAAAFPICGGAHPATAPLLLKTNWWIFHGLKDDVVDPEFSKKMADAIERRGGQMRLSLFPNANHNSWDSAFAEKGLLPWLFSNHK
jgi:predicted peptidase